MEEITNSFYDSDNENTLEQSNVSDYSELESECDSDNGSEILPVRRKCARLLSSNGSESSDEENQEEWI